MTVLAMDVLPDCTGYGAAVVLDVDHTGAVERCVGCDLAQPVMPSMRGIPGAVMAVRVLVRAEELPVVRCRACGRGEHGRCARWRCCCDHGSVDA